MLRSDFLQKSDFFCAVVHISFKCISCVTLQNMGYVSDLGPRMKVAWA